MEKTKAAFKALREDCGLSQQDVADEADVNVRSVKRWENDSVEGCMPPNDVWSFLLSARGALYEDARIIADDIIDSKKAVGRKEVFLRYYRTQEDLDAVQDGDQPVGYVNALMREVGRLLEKAEVSYTFSYDA